MRPLEASRVPEARGACRPEAAAAEVLPSEPDRGGEESGALAPAREVRPQRCPDVDGGVVVVETRHAPVLTERAEADQLTCPADRVRSRVTPARDGGGVFRTEGAEREAALVAQESPFLVKRGW